MTQKQFYKTRAWWYFSRYVLLYYSIDGKVQCCTSGRWYELNDKNIQCGHYKKSDQHRAVALEFKNVGPQCYQDNKYFSGKPEVMSKWIEKTHGKGTLEWLDIKKNNKCELNKLTLDLFKEEYKKKFNDLVKIKGNPWK